jgi:hypothetical protein
VFRLGFDIRNNDECLSARLGKAVQHVYRIAAFLQTIEIGFSMCQDYLSIHNQFPNQGNIDSSFTDEMQRLLELKHDSQSWSQAPFSIRISKDVVLRAIDLMSCNMRQFTMLFDGTNAPKVSAIGRQIMVIAPESNSLVCNCLSNRKQIKQMDSIREFISVI